MVASSTIFRMITSTIRAAIGVDVDTAISTIVIAVSIVGLVITETICN